jgi:hypothetical protein
MKSVKGLLAGFAAVGLLVAQPAQAQEANDFESGLGVPAGSGLLVFLFVVAALSIAAGIAFEDSNDRPTSP